MTKTTTDVIQMHHVALATEDLKSTIEFYTDVVGLEAGPTPSSSGPLQWMYAGENPVLHVFAISNGEKQRDGDFGVAHIALQIRNFDTAKARLEKHDIRYETNIIETRNTRQLFFNGPDGVRIELIEIGKIHD